MNLTGRSSADLPAALKKLGSSSIPLLLKERATDEPNTIAIRYKSNGVYRELSWATYRAAIRNTAAGLLACGVGPGDRIAIMGDICIQYLFADLGAMTLGAIPCGIYPTSSPEELAHVLKLVDARFFVAEDQEHLDRLLAAEALENKQLVDKILIVDDRALFLYDDPRIMLFREATRLGFESKEYLEQVDELEKKVQPSTYSAIIFTSGTTGHPKAAYRSQSADVIGFGYSFLEIMPELRDQPHRVVCQLPLAHGMGRAMALYVPLISSVIPHLGESNQSLPSLMNEVRPTYVMGVPRTWEKIVAHIQVGVESAGSLAHTAFRLATKVGRARVRELWINKRRHASWGLEVAYWPLWLTVIWPALHKIGLTYVSGAVSGGAPLAPVVHETMEAWGIPLRDMFGMTETGGIGTQAAWWPSPESPIRALSACRVRLSTDGELCLQSPGNILGYWNDPTATSSLFDSEKFIQSGDIATLDENDEFRIVDRKKDIIITSGGKNIAPAAVENALRCSPYISEVIVFGDQRKFVSALIEIDFENVSQWARQRQIAYTGHMSLAQNEQVVRLISSEIDELNKRLARVEQVKKFRILQKELVPEDGDTTPTRKVKRTHAYKLFGKLVEEMYEQDLEQEAVGALR